MDKCVFPPNYRAIVKAIPSVVFCRPLFTYGPDIYNPYRLKIDKHLRVHEQTHTIQQSDPEAWWEKYLVDPEFRFMQEVEAYRAQLESFIRARNTEKAIFRFAEGLAKQLSSPMYGSIANYDDSYRALAS